MIASHDDLLEKLLDFNFFAPNFFKIRSKSGEIKPLDLNRAQKYVDQRLDAQLKEQGMVRAVILKGRQSGCSTLVQARFTHRIITHRGMKAFILTHEQEATNHLFDITKRYITHLPEGLCPKADASASNKLYFKDFDSGYAIGTAGNRATGRSQTIQLLHGSEVGFWPFAEDHAKGLLQTISREPGTEVILESTANGIGNYFYNMWQAAIMGKSEYQAIFIPWYWQDEYTAKPINFTLTEEEQQFIDEHAQNGLTIPHLVWRRFKIAEFSNDYDKGLEHFKQEYPMNAVEAFRNPIENAFINATAVMKARNTEVDSDAPLIIGVDPGLTNDKTAIIRRRGRKAYKLEYFLNLNTMEIAGRVRRIILEERPKKVYIDVIGIGAGVVDRLHEELGREVVEGINVANKSYHRDKFRNKRAELWHETNEWLNQEADVELPDSDILHGELTCLGYKYDSSGRLVIESKDDLKRRGLPSPNGADALTYTFAGGDQDFRPVEVNDPSKGRNISGMLF